MQKIAILPASLLDHESLSVLCKRSKAFWGYSPEQMKAWDEDLTITASYIEEHTVYKAMLADQLVGFYTLLQRENKTSMDFLFIDPPAMGKGVGTTLLKHAVEFLLAKGISILWVEADPHAEAFYLKKGFERVGEHASSIPGRALPVMRKELE